jgi:hypothetical protein
METVQISVDTLKRLIGDLEDAINVCYNADGSTMEKSYPYAAGYSRSAMQSTVERLKRLK